MKKKIVMIVDDEKDIVFTVKEGLKKMNEDMEFQEAANGKEALKWMNQKKPNLVILDIMMPIMNGWDTAAKIKNTEKFKDIPIIFLTAKNDSLSKSMGRLIGDEYIQKPYLLSELHKKVGKILSSR